MTIQICGIEIIPSPMGGGWAVPHTIETRAVLVGFFGEGAYPIAPLGGCEGHIIEPWQTAELVEYLQEAEIDR